LADYNTFIVVDVESRKPILTTSSIRKSAKLLTTGYRIEVWNNNRLIDLLYGKDKTNGRLTPYYSAEKAYIRKKQARAEKRNKCDRNIKHMSSQTSNRLSNG